MTPAAPATVLVFLDPAFDDGRIADASQPQLMATDQGATRGDGVFESMLAVGGNPRKLDAHLKRLEGSAAAMDLRHSCRGRLAPGHWDGGPRVPLRSTRPARRTEDEVVVKLICHPRRRRRRQRPRAGCRPPPVPAAGRRQRETGIDVILLDRGYDSEVGERAPWLLLGAKTLSYAVNMAALRYAHKQGADDVIFTSSDGRVLEGPTSTVLLAHLDTSDDGAGGTRTVRRLITPAAGQRHPARAPRRARCSPPPRPRAGSSGYGPLEPRDLFDADAVWLISSIRLLAPVNHIDGKEIGTPALRKQLTAELNELFATIG